MDCSKQIHDFSPVLIQARTTATITNPTTAATTTTTTADAGAGAVVGGQ